MLLKFLSCFILIVLSYTCSFGQNDEEEEYHRKEFVFGVNLNTNAGLIGGGMFRYTQAINKKKYWNIGLEIVEVKHPNESRYSSGLTGDNYILGKANYLTVFRPNYGREYMIFSKGNEDGVQIDALFAVGPSIGMITPYYIEFSNPNYTQSDYERYDVNIHDPNIIDPNRILGAPGYFYGLGQSTFTLGLHAKAALTFEFGTFNTGVSGLEAGVLLESFAHKIVMLDLSSTVPTNNNQFFSSLYINIYFGGRR